MGILLQQFVDSITHSFTKVSNIIQIKIMLPENPRYIHYTNNAGISAVHASSENRDQIVVNVRGRYFEHTPSMTSLLSGFQ